MSDKKYYLEEEALVVLHSGEIPEVAYHGSIYYLTSDPEGPSFDLATEDLASLKKMVVKRYCEILRRDLAAKNRDKSIYRGLARGAANWARLKKFCARENLPVKAIQSEMAGRLREFIHNEATEVNSGKRSSCINLTADTLKNFFEELGLRPEDLPSAWKDLCFK